MDWRGAEVYLLCSQYLVLLGLMCVERGMGTLYISIPGLWGVLLLDVPLSFYSLVAFKPIYLKLQSLLT